MPAQRYIGFLYTLPRFPKSYNQYVSGLYLTKRYLWDTDINDLHNFATIRIL